jgi:presenilin-like A22 family membrane protease
MTQEMKLKRIFRVNMAIGFLVTAISVYLILTGHYDNLQQRIGAEALMNKIAVGGLLYVAGFWYMCVFRKQIFSKIKS